MRNLWLLPDYSQSGVIMAREGDVLQPLHETLDLSSLPQSLILGIPEELLNTRRENGFIYSQFAKTNHELSYFVCSMRAGTDIAGRSVCITNVQLLSQIESPVFPPRPPEWMTERESESIVKLTSLGSINSGGAASTFEMLEAVRLGNGWKTFSSERLVKSANPHSWMPKKKDNEFRLFGFALLALVLVLVILFFLRPL